MATPTAGPCGGPHSQKLQASRSGTYTCDICYESEVQHFIKTLCNHIVCAGCLEGIFERATKYQYQYPPSCCHGLPIPIDQVGHLLSVDLIQRFLDRRVERETWDKTYCHHPQCRTFIAPTSIVGNKAPCARCQEETCSSCKGPWHLAKCPEDFDRKHFLEICQSNGWQSCPKRENVCSKDDGCGDVICRVCGFNFCFVCGDPMQDHGSPCVEDDEEAEDGENRERSDGGQDDEADKDDDHREVSVVEG